MKRPQVGLATALAWHQTTATGPLALKLHMLSRTQRRQPVGIGIAWVQMASMASPWNKMQKRQLAVIAAL